MTKEQIISEAMELDSREREAIDLAWLEESRRRDAALRAGQTKVFPVAEAIGRVLGGHNP